MTTTTNLSVTQLKQLLASHHIDYSSCYEKSDLISLALLHNISLDSPSTTTTTTTTSTPTTSTNSSSSVETQVGGSGGSVDRGSGSGGGGDDSVVMYEWKVKDLKQFMESHGVDYTGCYEKQELIDLAIKHSLIDAVTFQKTEKGKQIGFSVKVPKDQAKTLKKEEDDQQQQQQPQIDLNSFISNVKNEMVPIVVNQFREMKIDKLEEKVDGGKGIGEIQFVIEDLQFEKVDLTPEDVDIDFQLPNINIKISNITPHLPKFKWSYKKLSFPKISSSGKALIEITKIDTNCSIIFKPAPPYFVVSNCEVHIEDIKIHFSDTKAKVFYNLLISAFSAHIKKAMEAQLTQMMMERLPQLLSGSFSQ